ncbi:MAG TPA: DUF1009 domain-containing protein [Desulfomicrobiaceae bacterium]|nr:DUF1009 domain-containing protein [Desulfomicrobiaceae bacterium]
MPSTLGLVAGGSRFPHAIAAAARNHGWRVVGVGFAPDTEPDLPQACDAFVWLRLGQLGGIIDFFRKQRVSHIVFAGPIHKPRALSLVPDFRAARLLLSLRTRGDDAILRAVRQTLEAEGWQVVGADTFLPHLITPQGVLTRTSPTEQQWTDIALGWEIAGAVGKWDVGQCVVVRHGVVLAVEAIEGTDQAIARAGDLGGPGAVVVKRAKPGQDRALDLPAVGPRTIETMAAAQASCLAVEAGGSLFFELEAALRLAHTHRITVVGYAGCAPEKSSRTGNPCARDHREEI